jgi:hypothetical protein
MKTLTLANQARKTAIKQTAKVSGRKFGEIPHRPKGYFGNLSLYSVG